MGSITSPSFFFARALAFLVTDKVAFFSSFFSSFFFISIGAGYAHKEGGDLETNLKGAGINKSLFRPMTAVGVNASDIKCTLGNQYQNCGNKAMPTMAAIFLWPAGEIMLIVTLRPPASIIP